MLEQKTKLILNIHRKDHSPIDINVSETINVGSDPRNDIVVNSIKNQPKHLLFRRLNGELILKNLAKNNQTFLNSIALEENKTYVLDENDHILIDDTEIFVKKVQDSFLAERIDSDGQKTATFSSEDEVNLSGASRLNSLFETNRDLSPEAKKIPIQESPKKPFRIKENISTRTNEPMDTSKALNLIFVKCYALSLDIFLTYFILGIIIPFYELERVVNHFLSSITAHFIVTISEHFSIQLDALFSLRSFSFFFALYLLSLVQVLLFGCTISQFLLGLKSRTLNTWPSLFSSRLKTVLFALILLPSQNDISKHPIFSAMRKAGAIFLMAFILISPLIISHDFNPNLTVVPFEKLKIKKELVTQSQDFESRRFQIAMQTELPYRFLILPKPFISKNETYSYGLEFHDIIEKKNLTLREIEAHSFEVYENLISYANPLQRIFIKSNLKKWNLREKKSFILASLNVSPLNLINIIQLYGPFFSSATLVKNKLLSPFEKAKTDFTLTSFAEDSPLFMISDKAKTILYLIAADAIYFFEIHSNGVESKTLTYFNNYVLNNLALIDINKTHYKKTNLDLFYALDKLIEGDEKSFLTYYVTLVNRDQTRLVSFKNQDLTFKVFEVIKDNLNELSPKLKSKESQITITQLINQLTPMEIPGEKR